MDRSPLAPKKFPDLPKICGIKLATAASGMRYEGRDDLLLITLAQNSSVAGVGRLHNNAVGRRRRRERRRSDRFRYGASLVYR